MEQNLEVFDFVLSEEEMPRIATMDTSASLLFSHRDPTMVS
jgi:2,5-diketo-D-gluconate reductase A